MSTQGIQPMNEIAPIDLQKTTTEITETLKNSSEIIALSREIDLKDANSIMSFGIKASTEISSFADKILHSIESSSVEDSGELLLNLNKIMDKFDIKDFKDEKPSFFSKIIKKSKNSIDNLLKKYHTMGGEVDKVYVQLKQYEAEINNSNNTLAEMFDKNMTYYEELEKYILSGNLVLNKVKDEFIPELENKAANSTQQLDQINLSNAYQVAEMIEQRVYDLELAKNVSLQTMPQIKLIQTGNYNLIRKINSAFIITMPIFKQCLTQAITLKRQAIQSKAMAAPDEKTNELLLRNAQNTALQSKLTATLASNSSVKIETLEQTWQTITQGINETKQIQAEAHQKRIDGTKRLRQIQQEFQSNTKTHN